MGNGRGRILGDMFTCTHELSLFSGGKPLLGLVKHLNNTEAELGSMGPAKAESVLPTFIAASREDGSPCGPRDR